MTQQQALAVLRQQGIIEPYADLTDCTGDVRTCPVDECLVCGVRACPHAEPLHFHHDGCPMCESLEPDRPI